MKTRTIAAALAAAAGLTAYLRFLRPRVLNWGATPDEAAAPLPGDEILPTATLQTTRVVAIDAPPAAVWPWLVQMGPRPRAGVYTYDWIERRLGIDIENSDRILPEFQHLDVGERFQINEGGTSLEVRAVEPNRALVLEWIPAGSSWAFVLEPLEHGRSRLISRNRLRGSGPRFWLGMVAFMEPGSLVMERKMLLGIKRRAEGRAR